MCIFVFVLQYVRNQENIASSQKKKKNRLEETKEVVTRRDGIET